VDRTGENRMASGQVYRRGVNFLQYSCCHSGCVRTRVAVKETGAFDRSTSSFWTKCWLYLGFKKLRILSCVDGSLFYQKIDEYDALRVPPPE